MRHSPCWRRRRSARTAGWRWWPRSSCAPAHCRHRLAGRRRGRSVRSGPGEDNRPRRPRARVGTSSARRRRSDPAHCPAGPRRCSTPRAPTARTCLPPSALAREYGIRLPLPGRRHRCRWAVLAALAARQPHRARVLEAHSDALAILAEAGDEPPHGTTWGVFAAEAPDVRLDATTAGRPQRHAHRRQAVVLARRRARRRAGDRARRRAAAAVPRSTCAHPSVRADPAAGLGGPRPARR